MMRLFALGLGAAIAVAAPALPADEPLTLSGSVTVKHLGFDAGFGGIGWALLGSACDVPVRVAGIAQGLARILENPEIAQRIEPSMGGVTRFLTSDFPVDCTALPIKASYYATVDFSVEERAPGLFTLRDGSIRWGGSSMTSFSWDGGTMRDSIQGQDALPLDPETDEVEVRLVDDTDPPNYILSLEVSHDLLIDGSSVLDVGPGITQIRMDFEGGIFRMGYPPILPVMAINDEPMQKLVAYAAQGERPRARAELRRRPPTTAVVRASLEMTPGPDGRLMPRPRLTSLGGATNRCEESTVTGSEAFKTLGGSKVFASHRLGLPPECPLTEAWSESEIATGASSYRDALLANLLPRYSLREISDDLARVGDCWPQRGECIGDLDGVRRSQVVTILDALDEMEEDCSRIAELLVTDFPKRCQDFIRCLSDASRSAFCSAITGGVAPFCFEVHIVLNSAIVPDAAQHQAHDMAMAQVPCLAQFYDAGDLKDVAEAMAKGRQPLAGLTSVE